MQPEGGSAGANAADRVSFVTMAVSNQEVREFQKFYGLTARVAHQSPVWHRTAAASNHYPAPRVGVKAKSPRRG